MKRTSLVHSGSAISMPRRHFPTNARPPRYATAMSAPLSAHGTATVVPSSTGHTRRGWRAASLAVMAAGVLLLFAAATLLLTFSFAARREGAERARWLEGEARIAAQRRGVFVAVPDPDSPTGTRPEWQVQPQLALEYELDGVAGTSWVDIPTNGRELSDGEAQMELGRYAIGDTILVWLDPDDVTALRLAIGDGGRRTAIAGCVLAFVLMMPGVGLIFAGWLWRRLAR
jgi:hypothetical protein